MRNILKYCLLLIPFFSFSQYCWGTSDTLRIKVMTYNLRLGELATLEDLANHIKAFNPDFVALQEVDVHTQRKLSPHQNGLDFISSLAFNTKMFGIYGKTIEYKGGYEGIGILSKYPYFEINKINLPNPQNKEPRVLLEGKFEINNDTIIFACTHLDVNSVDTRTLQAKFITKYFNSTQYPIILGGDFNARSYTPTITDIMNKYWFNATNNDFTFPAWNPFLKLDYVYALPMTEWHLIRTQAIQSSLSDHLPIITELEYIRN